jgi:glycosyltransferase involved in cell wall biosynthesis
MKQRSIQSTILAANTPKHKISVPESISEEIRIKAVPVNTRLNPFALIWNLLLSRIPYNVSRFRSCKFGRTLKALIVGNEFDIIQLEGLHMAVYLPLIRKYSKAKVTLRAHNVEHRLWQDIETEQKIFIVKYYVKLLAQRYKRFEKQIISSVDGVVAITRHDLEQLACLGPMRDKTVIPFILDAEKYTPSSVSIQNSVFFIGALDWIPNQKGIKWFLEYVWPELRKNFPSLSFHVAGRNAPDWLKTKCAKENINFHGEVADSVAFMNRFEIMIVPVFSGSGIRIKIMEAMALKKAIITTSKGAEGLNITPGQEMLIADSAETFKDQIAEILNNKAKQNSLGAAARAFISKEFDNLAISKRVEEFFYSLIHN